MTVRELKNRVFSRVSGSFAPNGAEGERFCPVQANRDSQFSFKGAFHGRPVKWSIRENGALVWQGMATGCADALSQAARSGSRMA